MLINCNVITFVLQLRIKDNTKMIKRNEIAEFSADIFSGSTEIVESANLLEVLFDFKYEEEDDSVHFTIKSFMLKTGLKKLHRKKEVDQVIQLPAESFDFAEKLLWKKYEDDQSFSENLHLPSEMFLCGHDLN